MTYLPRIIALTYSVCGTREITQVAEVEQHVIFRMSKPVSKPPEASCTWNKRVAGRTDQRITYWVYSSFCAYGRIALLGIKRPGNMREHSDVRQAGYNGRCVPIRERSRPVPHNKGHITLAIANPVGVGRLVRRPVKNIRIDQYNIEPNGACGHLHVAVDRRARLPTGVVSS